MSRADALIQPLTGRRAASLNATIDCPPDKSVTHRSIMFASMAQGTSKVIYPLLGADCRSTMGVFSALGVRISVHDATPTAPAHVLIDSPGWDHWQSPTTPLDFGNSGTTARLLLGLFAATPGLFVTCFGDASLSERPMGRVVEPLRRVGAQINGRDGGRKLPLAVNGTELRPGSHAIDKATAQVKSALLLAGLNVRGETVVTLPLGSRDHTERMLAALGAHLDVKRNTTTETVRVVGPFRPPAQTYVVPGDPSSAAFLPLACLVDGTITVRGMLDNPTRTGFLTVLERMGADIQRVPYPAAPGQLEPVCDLVIRGGKPLRAVDTEPELAPTLIDEVPILAVAAFYAAGTSRWRGLSELRVKESDRLAQTISLIRAAGDARAEGDDLLITGHAAASAFDFDPDDDHRLAMAAAILAKTASGRCRIRGPECVNVSFPGFFDVLGGLG